MQKSWKNTNDLNEALGDDFDVAAGWEAFNQPKDKKRPIPFWFWGSLSIIGLALIIGLCKTQEKQERSHPLSTNTSQQLNSTANPTTITTHSRSSKQFNEKEVSNKLAEHPPIVPVAYNVTPEPTTKKAQNDGVKNSFKVTKKSILKNKANKQSDKQYLSANIVESMLLMNSINTEFKNSLNSDIPTEKPISTTLKSISKTENNFNLLPTLLSPLVIKQKISIPEWNNFADSKRISIPQNKTRTFGLVYTYNLPTRVIKGKEEMYQSLRQNGEQFLEQQQVDFTLTQTFNRRFFLNVGLSYSRYRSRLVEEIQVVQSPVVYNDVIIETHSQNNIINEIRGTAIGSQLSINQSIRYQVYQTLAIPVQLGVQVPLKRDWQLSLGTGVAFNLWQPTKGNTYASILPDGEFTSIASLGYRSAGTLETISTFQIQKKIREQLSLQIGLQAKFDLNNRIKKEFGVSDKWKSYGLSIGISRTW